MSRTTVRAGRVLVALVDNAQGRRILLGQDNGRPGVQVVEHPITAATNKGEARALIKALRELVDELPNDPAAPEERAYPPKVIAL